MKAAIRKVAAKCAAKAAGNGTAESSGMGSVFVWADFSSIAQEHRGMQLAAVAALPMYASQAHAFVVVAPRAQHGNTRKVCDFE
eukprot:gene937-24968_t